MAKRKILAKDIKISVSEDDLIYTEIGCAEEGEITTETVFAEANCQEDDGLTTKEPAEQNFNASLSGVIAFDGVNETPQDLAINKLERWFKWSTGIAGDRRVRAKGFFTNLQETKGTADFGKYSLAFVNSEKAIFDKEEAVMICTLTNGDSINISITSTLTVAPRWLAVDDQGNTESGTTSTGFIGISLSTVADWTVYIYIDDPAKISRFSLESTQELFIDFTDYRLYQATFAVEEAPSFQGVKFSKSDKEIEFIALDQTATKEVDLSVIPNITKQIRFFQADNFEKIIFPSSGGSILTLGFRFDGSSTLIDPIIDLRGYKSIRKSLLIGNHNCENIYFNTDAESKIELAFQFMNNFRGINGINDILDVSNVFFQKLTMDDLPLIQGLKLHETEYSNLVTFKLEDLTGFTQDTLDFSNYTNIGAVGAGNFDEWFIISRVPNLQNIIFHSVYNSPIEKVKITENPNLGYVDLTAFENVLTDSLGSFQLFTNGWSAAIVNQILVDLDSLPNTIGGSISIQNNSAPDNSSGGFDGLAAVASLQAKGVTVTTD